MKNIIPKERVTIKNTKQFKTITKFQKIDLMMHNNNEIFIICGNSRSEKLLFQIL